MNKKINSKNIEKNKINEKKDLELIEQFKKGLKDLKEKKYIEC